MRAHWKSKSDELVAFHLETTSLMVKKTDILTRSYAAQLDGIRSSGNNYQLRLLELSE